MTAVGAVQTKTTLPLQNPFPKPHALKLQTYDLLLWNLKSGPRKWPRRRRRM